MRFEIGELIAVLLQQVILLPRTDPPAIIKRLLCSRHIKIIEQAGH